MSEFAPGSEHTFSATERIVNGRDAVAIQAASQAAQAKQDTWGAGCSKMVAAFTFKSGYEIYEVPGRGWFVEFTQQIRLYTLEESTTLPGDWSRKQEDG